MEKLEILVVEDQEKHLADVKEEMQKRIDAGMDLEVSYAKTYVEAKEMMGKKKFDGIVSDIFFPYDDKTHSDTDSCPTGWESAIASMCYDLLKDYGASYAPGKVLDELGVDKYCCRRMIITHCDLIDEFLQFEYPRKKD